MAKEQIKLYNERDIEMLDMENGYYTRHVMAMTGEGLNSKSAIAAELAYRDYIIDKQTEIINRLDERVRRK